MCISLELSITFNNISLISVFFPAELYLKAHPDRVSRYRYSRHGNLRAFVHPRKFDWRNRGAVGPVHDQKSVGVHKQEVLFSSGQSE